MAGNKPCHELTLPSKHKYGGRILLGRRNITKEQRDYLIGVRYRREKKQVGAPENNTNALKQIAQNEPIVSTAEKIAQQIGVSRETVKRVEKKPGADVARVKGILIVVITVYPENGRFHLCLSIFRQKPQIYFYHKILRVYYYFHIQGILPCRQLSPELL